MADYVALRKDKDSIQVCFYVENDKVMAIGEKMNAINDAAYMNGYNWEAFFRYYLEKNASEILEGMDTDPEAGMYSAYYEPTAENETRAERFVEIIRSLIDNEKEIYQIVQEEGDEIEWD